MKADTKFDVRRYLEMADDIEYSYLATEHHMDPFVNPIEGEAFIFKMEATFGKLWLFKTHISNWSFGVSR